MQNDIVKQPKTGTSGSSQPKVVNDVVPPQSSKIGGDAHVVPAEQPNQATDAPLAVNPNAADDLKPEHKQELNNQQNEASQPKQKKAGGPVIVIIFAVLICLILVGLAVYSKMSAK